VCKQSIALTTSFDIATGKATAFFFENMESSDVLLGVGVSQEPDLIKPCFFLGSLGWMMKMIGYYRMVRMLDASMSS